MWTTNDDDLVRERGIGFTRSSLLALEARPGREACWNFDGGDGGHHKPCLTVNDL